MGGLISRYRIEGIPSGDADVGKLIMMGTPNHGALLSEAESL
jgi:triacylglycerol esterase/lipase EstA (alpha/beta hydrolase family)